MISVEQAEQLVFSDVVDFSTERVALSAAFGRILREDIRADRDHPPTDRATMDGIAFQFAALQKGQRQFTVAGIQAAGHAPFDLEDPETCFEITTGASLPKDCDCVLPIEEVDLSEGIAVLTGRRKPKRRQFVHPSGTDYQKDEILLHAGQILDAPAILTAASVGMTTVSVSTLPSIAVIGTGDELVEIDQNVKPHQFRRSNAYALQAALQSFGFANTQRFHIRDDRKELKTSLKSLLSKFQALILSGGVSQGKFDFVPEVLRELGVEQRLHGVRQRPGKPFWFGIHEAAVPVFALPGNPISTLACAYRYAIPYLLASSGRALPAGEWAQLSHAIKPDKSLTLFCPVKLTSTPEANLVATVAAVAQSGQYRNLLGTDGFVEIPAVARGATLATGPFRVFRWSNGYV